MTTLIPHPALGAGVEPAASPLTEAHSAIELPQSWVRDSILSVKLQENKNPLVESGLEYACILKSSPQKSVIVTI